MIFTRLNKLPYSTTENCYLPLKPFIKGQSFNHNSKNEKLFLTQKQMSPFFSHLSIMTSSYR